MNSTLKKFLALILLWSGFGFALNQYLEQIPIEMVPEMVDSADDIKGTNDSEVQEGAELAAQENKQTLRENDPIATENDQTIAINSEASLQESSGSDPEPLPPTSSNVLKIDLEENIVAITRDSPELIYRSDWDKLVDLLVYNMQINPNLNLEIIGHFDPREPIADPNLGIQRSVRVKNKLVAKGLNPDRINCRGNLKRLFDENSTMVPPIVIKPSEALMQPEGSDSGSTAEQKTESSQRVNSSYVEANMNLPKYKSLLYQPTFSDQGIVADHKLIELIPSVTQWLDLDPKNYIEIIGHTDHVGHDQDNYRLALKWASQARSFLISKGISSGRIKALSAGEQQPLYTNSNSRGREKNRRIEFIFKF